jgi:ribosome-associated protein
MSNIHIKASELQFSFIRAPGPGGQNVNKVATAVLLRFNVQHSSSLTETLRARILTKLANKITQRGDLIIKATRFRTQERNKQDAIERLYDQLQRASLVPKKRKKTKPSLLSKERRLHTKKLHGKTKLLRKRNISHDE